MYNDPIRSCWSLTTFSQKFRPTMKTKGVFALVNWIRIKEIGSNQGNKEGFDGLGFYAQYTGVISQNGTSSSEYQHSSCWYTKGQFGLKWPKHYRWAWPLMHYPQTRLVYFYYEFWVAYATICIATCASYTSICISTRVYLHTRVPFEQPMYHTFFTYINIRVYFNSTLKIYISWLDEISWALIHNYPNCLNHTNLWTLSISKV